MILTSILGPHQLSVILIKSTATKHFHNYVGFQTFQGFFSSSLHGVGKQIHRNTRYLNLFLKRKLLNYISIRNTRRDEVVKKNARAEETQKS
jgi:hypothetical protein